MNPEQKEEWLSAYLDGELSADQRTQVESWLAESAELRQLHDELRAMRRSVQSLPSLKLDQDLAPTILRRAERAVLGSTPQRTGTGKIEPAGWIRAWWVAGDWRRWAWPSVALAAALLLLLFDDRQPPAEREVARAPRGESSIGAREDSADRASEALAKPTGTVEASAPARGDVSDEKITDSQVAERKLKEREAAPAASEQAGSSFAKSARKGAPVPLQVDEAPRAAPAMAGDKRAQIEPSARSADANDTYQVAEAPSDVVCDVTDEFIRQRSFEKLLTKKKVVWQRGQIQQQPVQAGTSNYGYQRDNLKDQQNSTAQERLDYVVNATPKQVNEIVVELQKQTAGVNQVSNQMQFRRSRARKLAVDGPDPVIFRLQAMPERPPADAKPPG